MLSSLYDGFFGKKPPSEKLQGDKKGEALPRAYFISGSRVATKSPQYQFVAAAASGDVEAMRKLLSDESKKINMKQLSEDQQKKWFDALSAAVLNGQEESVTFLLERRKEENRPVTVTDQALECAIVGNQINILKRLINVADAEELRGFNRLIRSYVVTQGSTALAAALRQPSALTIAYSLMMGIVDQEAKNNQASYKECHQKLQEVKAVHPVLATLFADRVKNIYQLELSVAVPRPVEIPAILSPSDLQDLTL